MKYDLVVAYRIYPGISKTPPAYPKDKYKLARFCLESFKKSLDGLKVKVYALLDDCPDVYESLFREFFDEEDLVCIKFPKAGNKATFTKQIELLASQEDADVVYFAEDDYFYIDKLQPMYDLIKSGTADFVSPYEHPSCYTDDHVIKNKIVLAEGHRFVNVQHACLTFMTTRKNLIKNKRFLKIYTNWFASDYVVWGTLTLGWSYFKYIKLLFSPKNYRLIQLKVYGSMFFFAWYRFICNRTYKLYMPIPTIAVHMEGNFLSPGINWDTYFADKQE